MANTYDLGTDIGAVRLLINDVAAPWVFSDEEITAFLTLEGGVKRAAAQAIDSQADNEVLVGKVFRSQDLSVDAAKAADALRKRAVELRRQADEADEGDGYFEIIETTLTHPELTEWRMY